MYYLMTNYIIYEIIILIIMKCIYIYMRRYRELLFEHRY